MNCLSHYILHSLCCPQQKLFSHHVWYLQIHTTTTSSSRHINLIFSWLADQKSVHFKIPLQFSCLVMHKTHSWPKKRLKRVGDPLDLFRPVQTDLTRVWGDALDLFRPVQTDLTHVWGDPLDLFRPVQTDLTRVWPVCNRFRCRLFWF